MKATPPPTIRLALTVKLKSVRSHDMRVARYRAIVLTTQPNYLNKIRLSGQYNRAVARNTHIMWPNLLQRIFKGQIVVSRGCGLQIRCQ